MARVRELGLGLLAGRSVGDMVRLARLAEELGFHTLWVAEDYFYGGAFATATACAVATNRIRIGIGVVNPFTRHPALIAMEAGALDAASGGRLRLGIGASNVRWIQEMMGIPFRQPVAAIRETVSIVRRLLSGEEVTFEGRIFQLRNVRLDFTPRRGRVPIYLGAKGPGTLRLAGKLADGILLSILTSRAYLRWALQRVEEGAAEAGRNLKDLEIATYLFISPDANRGAARERVRPAIAKYIGLHGEHPIMLEAGLTREEIRPFREAFLQGRTDEAAARVDDRLIDRFAAAGRPEECAESILRLAEVGVDRICAFEIPGQPVEVLMERIARDVAPLVL